MFLGTYTSKLNLLAVGASGSHERCWHTFPFLVELVIQEIILAFRVVFSVGKLFFF